MIYIPDGWLVNKDNMEAVHDILSAGFHTDINLSERIPKMLRQLREIGETDIADKLENHEITMPT